MRSAEGLRVVDEIVEVIGEKGRGPDGAEDIRDAGTSAKEGAFIVRKAGHDRLAVADLPRAGVIGAVVRGDPSVDAEAIPPGVGSTGRDEGDEVSELLSAGGDFVPPACPPFLRTGNASMVQPSGRSSEKTRVRPSE